MAGADVIDEPHLTVPHPRLPERPFVLVPLAEIAGDCRHPVLGATVAVLCERISPSDLVRVAGPEWRLARYLRGPG